MAGGGDRTAEPDAGLGGGLLINPPDGPAPGEVLRVRWREIEDGTWWVIPAEVAKNGEANRVPLSPQARRVLDQIRPTSSGSWRARTRRSLTSPGSILRASASSSAPRCAAGLPQPPPHGGHQDGLARCLTAGGPGDSQPQGLERRRHLQPVRHGPEEARGVRLRGPVSQPVVLPGDIGAVVLFSVGGSPEPGEEGLIKDRDVQGEHA